MRECDFRKWNGRPCSCPGSDGSWEGTPKTRSTLLCATAKSAGDLQLWVICDRAEPAAGRAMSAMARYCCKSPFAPLIRKFLGRRRVFRVRMWGVT